MPQQQQNSSFAAQLGGQVAQANAEAKDKPVDTGNRRLPPGIRDGVAKLSAMYTKEQTEEKSRIPKGKIFFRASAIVETPAEFKNANGQVEKIAGLVTQVVIPLCTIPANEQINRKEVTFKENFYEFQNIFRLLGIPPCPETGQTDPAGTRTEAYFMAAMKALTSPERQKTNPVYISFSTRGWTPPKTAKNPNPEEMTFETWHGLATPLQNGAPNPAAGVSQDNTHLLPPIDVPPGTFNEFEAPPTGEPQGAVDADAIAAMIETAMGDPEGATEEAVHVITQLQEIAWRNGWTKEQTSGAADWSAVGEMALTLPSQQPAPAQPTVAPAPTVGGHYKFCKRTKDGEKLRDAKGNTFPPTDVVVVTVDTVARTCTVKAAKDGKMIIDLRTKQPVVVKFEWLE